MKRISSLILAAAFVLGGMGAAHAIDVKVKGTWDFVFGWAQNTGFMDNNRINDHGGRNNDNFVARQRVRTQINFIASENLQGVLMFEIGTLDWGHNNRNGKDVGGSLDADGVNVKTKRAYLDWMVPDTSLAIRMGIQGLSLPMATGYNNPVFSADVAAVVANYKFDDTFAITAFWARPFNQYLNDDHAGQGNWNHLDDEMDMFGLVLPITLDGVTITPWGVWGRVGSASSFYEYYMRNSIDGIADDINDRMGAAGSPFRINNDRYTQNETATAWWAGLGIAVDIWDPLTFAIDGMYGHLQKQDVFNFSGIDADGNAYDGLPLGFGAEGWFITATLDYKLDWGTPGLFGWYSSGDTKSKFNADKLGRMPVVGTDDGFNPTSFGFAGAMSGVMTDSIISTGMGTWGVGLQIADMSFIENLSHTIRVAYIQGTNDHKLVKDYGDTVDYFTLSTDGQYMTNKDHAWEVNFDHKYQIYENLAAYLELGYINMDLDKSTWKNTSRDYKTDDAWKAQVLLRYQF